MQYDVIIIGSGLGGLYVGCLLSRYGMSVLLLERQKHLGGCMQSYVRDGYKFDTGLHYVGGLGEGQSLYSDFKDVGLMNLAWKRLDSEGFDRIVIGEKTYNFAEGLENFYETLLREFPKEKEGLREYINMLKTQRGNIDTFSISAYEYLKGVVKNPLLLNVLSGASFKTELNRDIFPLFSFIENNASYIESSWRLKGDGDMLVDTLV
ncbi:MAG TPA: NAD(P)/FAD-dependent oxidoreductase, partial [Porphyromonadaceae bacterium]|nr:NAD(P)/FAD-dependent oxidoreductase [Porphyromonadaceae bacterium]